MLNEYNEQALAIQNALVDKCPLVRWRVTTFSPDDEDIQLDYFNIYCTIFVNGQRLNILLCISQLELDMTKHHDNFLDSVIHKFVNKLAEEILQWRPS